MAPSPVRHALIRTQLPPSDSMSAPLVTLITINYNEVEETVQCLESVQALSYPNVECIVVDNGSASGQAAQLQDRFPDVNVIANPTNDGFAGGNNVAIRQAHGKYVLLLNNDARADSNLLERLVATMEEHSEVGVATPKIVYEGTADESGNRLIQYAGSSPINPYTGRSRNVGYKERDDGRFDEPGPTHLGHGAAMMIRYEVFEEIGLLNDTYFLYYEEHDFVERAKREGYTMYYEARATVRHKASVSVGRRSPLKAYYMTRNRFLFLRRNTRGMAFFMSALVFWGLAVPKRVIVALFRGETERLWAMIRGAAWHLWTAGIDVQEHPRLSESTSVPVSSFS